MNSVPQLRYLDARNPYKRSHKKRELQVVIMVRSPLMENMTEGRTSLGSSARDPNIVRQLAAVGFDWVQIDMMFTETDWNMVERLITTAEAVDITPVVRIQSNPHIGYDHRIAVDVTRAEGVGAQFIKMSYSCKKEIEECMAVSKDWHRRAAIVHPFKNFDEWDPKIKEMAAGTVIMPFAESKGGLSDMEEVLAIPGLKAFCIGLTDGSLSLSGTNKPDWYHPKLWEMINKAVKIGNDRGIMISANTSYVYSLDELAKRAKRLHDAGVRCIFMQPQAFLFQLAYQPFMDSVKKQISSS